MNMLPEDQYNRTLLDNVHPGDWQNPRPPGRYNLVVVGGGTAGLICAAIASALGARTALVERALMGGDCLNVGCVPSKAVIRGARAAGELTWLQNENLLSALPPSVSFEAVMERMRRIRAAISGHDSPGRYRDEFGVDVYVGNGTFTGPATLTVTGDDGSTRDLTFTRGVIATGARAAAPPIPGLETVSYLTNETLFSLTELPQRLVVIGAGPIGCEMAQSFARLGSAVTVLDMAPRVLPREDPDVARVVQEQLVDDGVRLILGASIQRVAPGGSGIAVHYRIDHGADAAAAAAATASGETAVSGTHLLVAIGRAPNLDNLGLEAAGVAFTRQGVVVDDHLRTTNRRIFAAGDVAVPLQFTHMAEATAGIAVQNALFLATARVSKLTVPWTTYTTPEVAHVGLSELEAARQGVEVDVYTHQMEKVDRARLEGETAGLVKLIVRRGRKEILGATVVAAHAGETIAEVVLAMKYRLGVDALASVIHPYPTQSEAVKRAAAGYLKKKLTPRTKGIMARWFAWRR